MEIIVLSLTTIIIMSLNKLLNLSDLYNLLFKILSEIFGANKYISNTFLKFQQTVFKTIKMSVSGRKFVKVFAI